MGPKRVHKVLRKEPKEFGNVLLNSSRETAHMVDRYDRLKKWREILNEDIGNAVDTFLVDKEHWNGPEYHVITDTGLTMVYNSRTLKLISILISRPQQLKRNYEALGLKIPSIIHKLIKKFISRLNQGYDLNNW